MSAVPAMPIQPRTVRTFVERDVRLHPDLWREGFSVADVQRRLRDQGFGWFANGTVRQALEKKTAKQELVKFFRGGTGRSWEGVPVAHFRTPAPAVTHSI